MQKFHSIYRILQSLFSVWNYKGLHWCTAAHSKANVALMLRKILNLWSNISTSKPKYVSWTPPKMVEYVLQLALCKLSFLSSIYAESGKTLLWVQKGLFLCCYAVTLAVHLCHPPYGEVFSLTLRYRNEINIRASRILEMVFKQFQAHLHENLP